MPYYPDQEWGAPYGGSYFLPRFDLGASDPFYGGYSPFQAVDFGMVQSPPPNWGAASGAMPYRPMAPSGNIQPMGGGFDAGFTPSGGAPVSSYLGGASKTGGGWPNFLAGNYDLGMVPGQAPSMEDAFAPKRRNQSFDLGMTRANPPSTASGGVDFSANYKPMAPRGGIAPMRSFLPWR